LPEQEWDARRGGVGGSVLFCFRYIEKFAAKLHISFQKTIPSFSILRQNAIYFAAKRNPFCGKTQSILRQNRNGDYRNSRAAAGLQ